MRNVLKRGWKKFDLGLGPDFKFLRTWFRNNLIPENQFACVLNPTHKGPGVGAPGPFFHTFQNILREKSIRKVSYEWESVEHTYA